MNVIFDALARFVVLFDGMCAALIVPVLAVFLLVGMMWHVARGPKEMR